MSYIIKDLKFLTELTKEAGTIFKQNENNFNQLEDDYYREVKIKGDRKLNNYLINQIKKYNDYNIISEEQNQNKYDLAGYNWIIDPVDGSYNYLRGLPIYCISAALWKGMEPVFGVIYDLKNNDIYHGVIGDGAYKNEDKINVSSTNTYSNAVLCTGFPVNFDYKSKKNIVTFVDNIIKYKKIRMLGSAAMSLSLLASGVVDAYTENNIMIWDVAAGIAIVMASGGYVKFENTSKKHSLNVTANNGMLK